MSLLAMRGCQPRPTTAGLRLCRTQCKSLAFQMALTMMPSYLISPQWLPGVYWTLDMPGGFHLLQNHLAIHPGGQLDLLRPARELATLAYSVCSRSLEDAMPRRSCPAPRRWSLPQYPWLTGRPGRMAGPILDITIR